MQKDKSTGKRVENNVHESKRWKREDMVINRESSGTKKTQFLKGKKNNLFCTFPIHILEDPELWPPGFQSPQIGQK